MGNKCIGKADIFAAKDGIYVSDPSCYVVGSDVVKYSKKSTTIDGVTTVTYIDEAGVETASLPVGAEQIDCSKVVFVGNSGSTIPTVQDCDGNDAVPVYDQCSITAINTAKDAIVAAINGRPDHTAQLTSIGDTLTAMKSDTAAINTGVASSLVLLQAIVDKPDPTPVDLQPVLDKLEELIALETTENSTLVDVKNQLIAANVTLSNAETLLTHIDADMHDVVAKLQSALDLLTSLQTLLTTIDGRIAAIQTAITTADANNVSALNDIRTELQAINVNTDTLEALITAGNVLLSAIASNTDEVEGLLTEIRDLTGVDCDNAPAMKTFDACVKSAVEAGTAAVVAAINGRPDYTAQLTSIGDTLTAMKSDTAAINTGVASSLVLLQAIVDKPDPTPADLQPVLDKLDSLIALETTENSTLVDIKNQLVAANVTLSNAVGLLTHIDTDMHDVVAKLQSVIGLLTSLQTLLTTIDGHIVAVKSAITTADANNVSALNNVKTALQAININTDTLEALITAGNVSLRAIVNNTDGVEGLLTEIRDLPVTDSWFLLYDFVAPSSNNGGNVGQCKPFIRRIVDNVVTDTKLDLTTPYTVVGEVRTSCPDAQTGAQTGCTCTDELTQIKSVIDDINYKIFPPSVSPRSVVYSHKTTAYTVAVAYKSLSVSFENDGTVNGKYVPAGYSFTHDYFDGGYANGVILNGTSYMVWEGR